MTGLYRRNSLKHGIRADHARKRKYLIQGGQIHLPLYQGMFQYRLDFRSKNKMMTDRRIKQRRNAHMISGKHQRVSFFIEYRKSKLPIEQIQKFCAVFFIQMNQDFHITVGIKAMPLGNQAISEFFVIVNFTVADRHDAFIFVEHGLIAAAQVNNRKPPKAEAQPLIKIMPKIVGSPMNQRIGHSFKQRRINSSLSGHIV